MIVSMENADKLPTRLRRVLGCRVEHKGHLAFFGMRSFTRTLQENGLHVEYSRSIGYLYGMHTVTKYIPLPVTPLELLNRVIDRLASSIMQHAGHVLILVARKPGERPSSASLEHPFQCPACASPSTFGVPECTQCGRPSVYEDGDILLSLPRAE